MNSMKARCRLRSAEDVLGAVPFLFGFHPTDSIVAVFIGTDAVIRAVGRADLDTPPGEVVAQFRAVAGRDVSCVVLLGYGRVPHHGVLNDVIRGLRRDVAVVGGLWVSDGEYRCVWDGCDCVAAAGVAFDPRVTVSAATLIAQGHVAAPSRSAVLNELAADPGAHAEIRAAIEHLDACPGSFTVADALRIAERGERLDTAQAAALAVLLLQPHAREQAWRATDGQPWQRQLWFDLTRRVPDSHLSAVATLAAWWAWRTGDEMLAREALRRAVDSGPPSAFTRIVAECVTARIDPGSLPWPMNSDMETPTLRQRA
ncbi:DUF4192 domain-containing protein [Actinoplanes sp. NPDC049118]|uniref:DUF4192 domain-containing protein n=1 Tax=Actinoplanes sp. NPDC049118 TaxID=3155769 RepID=UPI0033D3F235